MMFQRFFDDGHRRNSYLLACPRVREAVIIDPRRDVDVYVETAHALGLRIAYVFDTHLHSDVASGARELLPLGTKIIAGRGAGLRYTHHEATHGERLRIGDLSILFIHTPGHTREHISILASQPEQPVRLFTGDTLLVGGIGMPESADAEPAEGRHLAAALHDSLFSSILPLDDRIHLHPGRLAEPGSRDTLPPAPFSNIGREKRENPWLQHATRESFIEQVLAGAAPLQPSGSRLTRMNREGAPLLGLANGYRGPGGISPGAAATAVRAGGIVLDLRDPAEFAAGHPHAAINLPPGAGIGGRALQVLPHDPRVVLLAADRGEAEDTARRLLRVGISRIDGYINGGFVAWKAAGLPCSRHDSALSV